MKNKSRLSVLAVAALALATVNASANTITVDFVSTAGAGPFTWTYNTLFANSELSAAGTSFFELADVGGFIPGSVVGVPAGWTLTTPATGSPIGPAASGNADSGVIPNLLFTWTGANVESPANFMWSFSSTIGTSANESFSSRDQVLVVGSGDGGVSVAGGALLVPAPVPTPDGGSTVLSLSAVLLALGLLRKKFSA